MRMLWHTPPGKISLARSFSSAEAGVRLRYLSKISKGVLPWFYRGGLLRFESFVAWGEAMVKRAFGSALTDVLHWRCVLIRLGSRPIETHKDKRLVEKIKPAAPAHS